MNIRVYTYIFVDDKTIEIIKYETIIMNILFNVI